jgi:hypothetical protein
MDYVSFHCILERLNANCLGPSLKLSHAYGEFLLQPHLFISGDTINLSLQLDSDALHIKQARGCGFFLSFGLANLKLLSLVGSHMCQPISLVFGSSFH